MARNYDIDSKAAREANSGGKRITEPGAYVGTIKQAWYEKNDKGTESVNLTFATESGQEAGPLVLYTHNADGEPIFGFKLLNALLTCARVRKLEAKRGKVKLWDGKGEIERDKDVYPALIGKAIGLILQGEEYENSKGELKQRLLMFAPFCAESRRMAGEVLDTTPAVQLDRTLAWFEGHKVRKLSGGRATRQEAPAPAGSEDFEDSIPF